MVFSYRSLLGELSGSTRPLEGMHIIEQQQLSIEEGTGVRFLQPLPAGSWAALESHAACAASWFFMVQVNLKRKHWDARGPQQRMQQLFKKQLAEAGHRATQRTHVPSLRQQHQERLQAKERDHTRSEVGHHPSCGCPLPLTEDRTFSLLACHCLYRHCVCCASPS